MRTNVKILLFLILALSAFSQELIATSDGSVEIYEDDDDNGPRLLTQDPKNLAQIISGSFGGAIRLNQTNQNGTRQNQTRPQNNSNSSNSGPSGKSVFASFGEPNNEAIAQSKNVDQLSLRSSAAKQADQSLGSARWIYPGLWPWRKVVFLTPCLHNPCPKGKLTIYIKATCKFTVYLVDKYGNYVSTIGSGFAWGSYAFDFYTDCGSYRVKIVLKCGCQCAFVKYNIFQDQKDCFKCPDDLRHNYNPLTCQCECSSSCQDCKKPQVWFDYPECSCGCKRQKCLPNQYFDTRDCVCKCIPRCCRWDPFGRPCGC